jgi:chromosome segregation ATPase
MSQITVVQNIPNDRLIKLSIEGQEEVYSLKSRPAVTSQLVLACEKEILQSLSLSSVVSNLANAADLMFVAYNALAGTQVQSKMSGLQKSLLDVSADCILTVTAFEVNSEEVINYTIKSYKWLFDGQEKLAITQLVRCGEVAKTMATEAEKLAGHFKQLGNKSQEVLEGAINEESLEFNKKKELEAKLGELKANKKNAESLQKSLEAAYNEMQEAYLEAKEVETRESDRAFALGLTSAIFSGLSSGLGAVAQITMAAYPTTNAAMAVRQVTNQVVSQVGKPSNNQNTSENTDLVKKLEEAQAEKIKLEKKRDENQAKINTAQGILKDTTDEKVISEKKEELKNLNEEKENINEKLQNATKAINSISQGLNNLSDKVERLGTQAQTAAENAAQQKMEFFKLKNQMAAENRKTLAALEEYAVRVSNTNVSISNAATAVETLHCAVTALSQIVVSLNQASLFWRSMEEYCKRLQKSEFLDEVKLLQNIDKTERIGYYSEPEFMQSAVTNLCRWVALNNVCQQYVKAVNDTYKQVGDNIKAAPSIKEAQAQAPLLAKKILVSVRKEMQIIDAKVLELP